MSSSGDMSLRVLMLAIASRGDAYDRMRAALAKHYESANVDGHWLDLRFVYGSEPGHEPGHEPAGGMDVVVADVPECKIPGEFDKTITALSGSSGYDFVIRTNLSTVFHYDLLRAYLQTLPRSGVLTGCMADDGSHVSGFCMIMTPDVVDKLVDRAAGAPRDEFDDVAICRVLHDVPMVHVADRIDVYAAEGVMTQYGESLDRAWVLRHKSTDRDLDATFMTGLVQGYADGHRGVQDLLNAAISNTNKMLRDPQCPTTSLT